jgi:Ca2+-binding RTX toxin-like protein
MPKNFDKTSHFKIDMNAIDLKQYGKITDADVTDTSVDVTFKHNWSFDATGTGITFTPGADGELPTVTGGTIETLTIDGPGKFGFSVTGLGMTADAYFDTLVNFKTEQVMELVLAGDSTIVGSGFADNLFGGDGNDTIEGGAGRDKIAGQLGDDTLKGGAGGDWLIGGEGADSFVFEASSGKDVVADFDGTVDVLDLTATGFSGTLEELLDGAKAGNGSHDGDLTLSLGDGSTIRLVDVDISELNETNVLL